MPSWKLRGEAPADVGRAIAAATELARQNGRMVFVTLAEEGILATMPDGTAIHVPALPLRGEIDIVGAGDAVLANLAAALAAANVRGNHWNWPSPLPRSSFTSLALPARRPSRRLPMC